MVRAERVPNLIGVRRQLLVVLIALTAVAVTVMVAGGGDAADSGDSGGARREAGATSPSSRPSPSTTTTRPRRGTGTPVTLAFGGDTHFEGTLRSQLDSNPGGMFAPIAPVLSGADVAMVNLETAITERGTPDTKNYNFRAPARAFGALRAAGIDAVTMANNHGRDYGPVGLSDTLLAKPQAGLAVLGVGANATEAYAPWVTEVKGQKLAVFAATDVIDDWLIQPWTATDTQPGLASTKAAAVDRLVAGIGAVREDVDTVIVFLHWGAEGSQCPTPRQQQLAQQLVDAGADVIVGSHAHRVQTAGRLGNALVDYGLGNFAFYNESGLAGVTGVLRVTVTGRDVDGYEWVPARIRNGIPHPLDASAAAADQQAFASRRACAALAP
jgi:poly-gamma-glutamate synthesis protein (capsule biosynthesis protein)